MPGAVLVAVGVLCLQIATFYFTRELERNSSLYGALGVAIVLLVWLYFAGRLIVAAAMLNERVRFRRTGERAGRTLLGDGPSQAPPDVTDTHRLLLANMTEEGIDMPADPSQTPQKPLATAGDEPPEAAPGAARAEGEKDAAAGGDDASATVSPPVKNRRRHVKARRWTALALVCFAVLIWIVTAIALWSHSLLFDSDKYVATVAPIIKDPQVTESLGKVIAEKTIEAVGLQELLEAELPSGAGSVAEPVTAQVQELLAEQVTKLLRTDQAYQAWESIQRFTHEHLIAILRDESTVIQLEGESVTLDLVPLIVAAIEKLEEILPGVIADRAPLPEFDPTATVEEQRQELADYLGQPVDEDFGQIVLFEDERVEVVQQAVKLFDVLVWALLGIAIAVVIAALLISPRRLRTLLQLGVGAVIVVVVARVAIDQLQAAIVANATGDGGVIVRSVLETVFGSLQDAIIWLLVGGIIIAVLAYVASTPKWLVGAWHGTAAWGRTAWHAAVEQTTKDDSRTVVWIRGHIDVLRIAIGAVAVAILLFGSPGWAWALVIVIVAVALIGGLTWLGRRPSGAGPATS
jgi:hypothetical protein